MTTGMGAATGRGFDDELDHIRQSIADILNTPIGSRVMRRDYGSMLPDLVDQPGNDAGLLRLRAATVAAIARWEPRVRVTGVTFDNDMDGNAALDLSLLRLTGPRSGSTSRISLPL